MPEPTILEAAAWAAAEALTLARYSNVGIFFLKSEEERRQVIAAALPSARAALAAAEPLMHEGRLTWESVETAEYVRELRAENARLREALTVIDTRLTASTALGVPFVESSRDVARTALAPYDEMVADLNPNGERCGLCGRVARGHARVTTGDLERAALYAEDYDALAVLLDPETMLRAWEKAGRVEWQIATDRRGNVKSGVWRIVPDEEGAT